MERPKFGKALALVAGFMAAVVSAVWLRPGPERYAAPAGMVWMQAGLRHSDRFNDDAAFRGEAEVLLGKGVQAHAMAVTGRKDSNDPDDESGVCRGHDCASGLYLHILVPNTHARLAAGLSYAANKVPPPASDVVTASSGWRVPPPK